MLLVTPESLTGGVSEFFEQYPHMAYLYNSALAARQEVSLVPCNKNGKSKYSIVRVGINGIVYPVHQTGVTRVPDSSGKPYLRFACLGQHPIHICSASHMNAVYIVPATALPPCHIFTTVIDRNPKNRNHVYRDAWYLLGQPTAR